MRSGDHLGSELIARKGAGDQLQAATDLATKITPTMAESMVTGIPTTDLALDVHDNTGILPFLLGSKRNYGKI